MSGDQSTTSTEIAGAAHVARVLGMTDDAADDTRRTALPQDREPVPPPREPQAIRACLTQLVAFEFDREWEIVLELAKHSKELTEVHALLAKWQHFAYAELKDPGSYYQLLAKATHILATGGNPEAVPIEDVQDLIRNRLAEQVHSDET
jgi:hypothetical protein